MQNDEDVKARTHTYCSTQTTATYTHTRRHTHAHTLVGGQWEKGSAAWEAANFFFLWLMFHLAMTPQDVSVCVLTSPEWVVFVLTWLGRVEMLSMRVK